MPRKIAYWLFILCITTTAQTKSEKIDRLIKLYNENRSFSGAVLVAELGNVIYSRGIGMANYEWDIPNSSDTKFRIGSLTKQFTAAIILKLNELGKLKLDNKITDILQDYPKITGDKITIHHLLSHSSGVPDYTSFDNLVEMVRKSLTPQQLMDTFKDKDLEFEPGTRWAYSNSGYVILGNIIEKVTGMSYEQALKKYVLEPCGMINSGYDHARALLVKRASGYNRSPNGFTNCDFVDMSNPYAGGAMYSTIGDLYKWDQALYNNKILSEESKSKAFTGYFDSFGGKYGYGWVIKDIPCSANGKFTRALMHGGGIYGFSSYIIRLIEDKNLVIILNNTPPENLAAMGMEICNILYDMPYNLPKKSAAEKLLKDYSTSGIETAVKKYMEAAKSGNPEYSFDQYELNAMGCNFLYGNKLPEALAVFKLNIEINPDYANGYDSYAEALLASGDNVNAIINYKKSLELDPDNKNAAEMLKKINNSDNSESRINK